MLLSLLLIGFLRPDAAAGETPVGCTVDTRRSGGVGTDGAFSGQFLDHCLVMLSKNILLLGSKYVELIPCLLLCAYLKGEERKKERKISINGTYLRIHENNIQKRTSNTSCARPKPNLRISVLI